MFVQNATSAAGMAQSSGSSAPQSTESQFAELLAGQSPEEILHEITKDGMKSLWEWQIKEMKKKIAAEIMGEMNLTPEKLAAMSAEQRTDIEDKIMKMVEERIKEFVEEETRKKQKTPFDISLDSTSLQNLILIAQGPEGDYSEATKASK